MPNVPAPTNEDQGSARPEASEKVDLERLSVGLLVLLIYLVFELIDITLVGFDVMYDGVGALLLLFVARCIDQPAVRRYGAPSWAIWSAAGARLVGAALALPLLSALVPDVVVGAVALVYDASLVGLALALGRLCAGRGLSSSARWSRATLLLALTTLLPAIVGAVIGNWPRVGLPLRFSTDEGFFIASVGLVLYVVSLVGLVEFGLATFTTLRSARRRT